MVDTSTAAPKIQGMFGTIAERYDLANSVLSFGIHHLWKQRLIDELPSIPNACALDLCTGTADLVPLLRTKFSKVVGADFCVPMLRAGHNKINQTDGTSILVGADAYRLPFSDASFDVVTVAFGVRNFENLVGCLKEIRRVLKPNGRLAILEFGQPRNVLFAKVYQFYSKYIMPVLGGVLTGNMTAYQYLPESAAKFPCDQKFAALLQQNGYRVNQVSACFNGIAYIYQAVK